MKVVEKDNLQIITAVPRKHLKCKDATFSMELIILYDLCLLKETFCILYDTNKNDKEINRIINY